MPRLSMASISAASSTTSPRLVLSRTAPSFILARNSVSTMPLVSVEPGTCSETMSLVASSSSSVSTNVMPVLRRERQRGRPAGLGDGDDVDAERAAGGRRDANVADADDAHATAEEALGLRVRLVPGPARRSAVPAAMWRSMAMRSPIVSWRRQGRSCRARCTQRPELSGSVAVDRVGAGAGPDDEPSESAWSSAAAVTLVERTISTSKPAMCSGRVSASRSGMRVTSSPAASSRSTAASGRVGEQHLHRSLLLHLRTECDLRVAIENRSVWWNGSV